MYCVEEISLVVKPVLHSCNTCLTTCDISLYMVFNIIGIKQMMNYTFLSLVIPWHAAIIKQKRTLTH